MFEVHVVPESAQYSPKWRLFGLSAIEVLVVLAIIAIVAVILYAPVQMAKSHRGRDECRINLKSIGLALNSYHEEYGSFPPAYIADKAGRPMHSWRVLLLPFLGQTQVYKEYRFDEPWNSSNNSKLGLRLAGLYVCPEEYGLKGRNRVTMTSYVAVLGPDTMWPGNGAVKFSDVKDGSGKTISVVEIKNSGIHWLEPRDLEFSSMASTVNHPSIPGISSVHKKGAKVLFVDGHVWFLSEDLPAQTIQALLTRNGGESVGEY